MAVAAMVPTAPRLIMGRVRLSRPQKTRKSRPASKKRWERYSRSLEECLRPTMLGKSRLKRPTVLGAISTPALPGML